MNDLKAYKPGNMRTKSNMDTDDDEDRSFPPVLEMKRKPYKQYNQIFTASHYHFYLSESIGAPADYVDMVHTIMCANESDTIFIHLNTPGGQLETGIQIINAIQNTAARVVTILESTAYSMGSLIFLAGDEMIVNDNCMMMFHNFNGGFVGKGNELTSELEATVKWYATLAKNLYVPFLTEDELSRITRGEDMWMQSPEIRQRLENMVSILANANNPPVETEVSQVVELTSVKPKRAPAKKVPRKLK